MGSKLINNRFAFVNLSWLLVRICIKCMLRDVTETAFAAAPRPNLSDHQTAVDKAKMAALDSIAYRIKTRFGNLQSDLVKDYELEIDSSLTEEFGFVENSIVSFTLTGNKTDKKEVKKVNNFYRAFVSVQVPVVSIKDVFISEIKKNGKLYTLLNVFPQK